MAKRKRHPFKAVFRTDPFGWSRFQREGLGFGSVGAVHKGRIDEKPYRFANETICGALAQAIRLPIPTFVVSRFAKQASVDLPEQLVFSSIDYNYDRESEPLSDYDLCVRYQEHLCVGALLFDVLIANPDRRRENMWCDNAASPNQLLFFDHDVALLGGETGGIDRIRSLESSDDLGLAYDVGGIDWHPFLTRVSSVAHIADWLHRISCIPKWFIEEVCKAASDYEIFGSRCTGDREVFTWSS